MSNIVGEIAGAGNLSVGSSTPNSKSRQRPIGPDLARQRVLYYDAIWWLSRHLFTGKFGVSSILNDLDRVRLAAMRPSDGEPTWDVALLFPKQGHWSESDYLAIDTNRMVELANGRLEVLPMPTLFHQLLAQFLNLALVKHVQTTNSGLVLFAPLPVHLFPGTYREPDIVYLNPQRVLDFHAPVRGADLVVEIMSDGVENRNRDLVVKREEYARAGITEYWIVDPQEKCVLVLVLDGASYRVHSESRPGDRASSVLLPGFRIQVDALFESAEKSAAAN